MTPVIIGDCTLYLGDSRDILPTLGKIDAIVTDPPYGLGKPSGTISKGRAHKRAYLSFEDTEDYLTATCVPIVVASLALAEGRGVITPGGAHAWKYPPPKSLGGFYQPAACGMCHWGRLTFQPILFYGRDPMVGKTIKNITYVLTEKSSCKEHPCAKPQKAWDWVVERASMAGETVLDPFMGSGTTGVSCVTLGRKFIGIELEEKFFDLSCRRIEEAQKQGAINV